MEHCLLPTETVLTVAVSKTDAGATDETLCLLLSYHHLCGDDFSGVCACVTRAT